MKGGRGIREEGIRKKRVIRRDKDERKRDNIGIRNNEGRKRDKRGRNKEKVSD